MSLDRHTLLQKQSSAVIASDHLSARQSIRHRLNKQRVDHLATKSIDDRKKMWTFKVNNAFSSCLYRTFLAITHGISEHIGSIKAGKMADIVR